MTTLVWSDEFVGPAGSAPDPTKWYHDVGPGAAIGGNSELETYVNDREHSFLDGDSNLVIRATSDGNGVYNSARIKTLGLHARYHGSWEARIKFTKTPGTWPAWWLMGSNPSQYPQCGEVDIFEVYGVDWESSTTVWAPQGSNMVYSKEASWPIDSDWHVYRMWWNYRNSYMKFYRDDKVYLTVRPADLTNWPYSSHNPLYTVLNVAVGGSGGGDPTSTTFPVDLLVDYVRQYDGSPA